MEGGCWAAWCSLPRREIAPGILRKCTGEQATRQEPTPHAEPDAGRTTFPTWSQVTPGPPQRPLPHRPACDASENCGRETRVGSWRALLRESRTSPMCRPPPGTPARA